MEAVLIYLAAILVAGLVIVLRLRKSRNEALEQIVGLQKKVAALEERAVELERAEKQAPAPEIEIFADASQMTARLQLFAQGQREIDLASNRLKVMKAELPFDEPVEQKYVEELDSIVNSLERASGQDVSGWLGISLQERRAGNWPRNRDLFRLKILSLLAFCTYQNYHPRLPTIISQARPGSRFIH